MIGALSIVEVGPAGTALSRYDAACRAIAEAVAVDEVMQLRDQADMMRAAARIAKNRNLEIQAIELRMRGERKLGELIKAQKETVGLAKGGTPYRDSSTRTQSEQVENRPPTLEEAGIDRKLSSRAQKMATMPPDEFEDLLGTWKEESAALDGRLTTDLLRVGAEERQRQARRDLAQTLSDASVEMTGQRKYPAIYFDPPWKRKQGITDRSYENHYVTMTWDQIIAWARSMRDRLLDDAWGFMWVPRAHAFALHSTPYEVTIGDGTVHEVAIKTPLAWAVASAMGFDAFSTCFVWTKTDEEQPDDVGTGILVRDQDELLLMFKKGRGLPKPRSTEIFGSNHRERSKPLGHSRKPQHYREMIAKITGGVAVLECFARHDGRYPLPANWDSWGNEASDRSLDGALRQ
ncbi:MT-A70 [Bradyrhizobium brasilense]|uniref:MT-A70 n=1 Tax=Bradyrhizobium brasilense TaxID=1419277 RepID=A0A1G6L5G5_9BRAD|nr:hypothetical protein [Bradyrhizobium brasilense]SDC38569.1 MT-A70 [Bradyrhizobium brasilense]